MMKITQRLGVSLVLQLPHPGLKQRQGLAKPKEGHVEPGRSVYEPGEWCRMYRTKNRVASIVEVTRPPVLIGK